MTVGDLEVPEFEPSDESTSSMEILIQCMVETLDVKMEEILIYKYSLTVSYPELPTKILDRVDVIIGMVGAFMSIDILIGFARDEQRYSILFSRSERVCDRGIESIDKYGYGNISQF